jgi:hypothetical protein
MAVTLEIDDGDPWWLSPDLWVVPGNDPTGPPGTPIAGQTAFLWARVHNTGSDAIENATVNFYWANPATAFDRSTANRVGTSFVSLLAGATQEVLCLAPWVPSFVNGGHECILAEAYDPSADPLPPGPDFNVPTDRHVAQRNLAVLAVAPDNLRFQLAFEVHNPSRTREEFSIRAESGTSEQLKRALRLSPKLVSHKGKQGRAVKLGFARQSCADADAEREDAPRLTLAPLERRGLSLVGELKGEVALVNVLQLRNDKVVGGLSVLAHAGELEKEEQP